ncbi:MAG: gamma-glutamyl-gamma-aminobutyrate hydrolase family protein, partial [candidate division Zixibacteria bacterium]
HQDLTCVEGKTLKHADPKQTAKIFHKARINKDSLLYKIINQEVIEVNSSHHQVVNRPGRNLKAVAFAPDGVVEGLEHQGKDFVMSVQWHPEGIYSRPHSKKLFDYFVKKAAKYK